MKFFHGGDDIRNVFDDVFGAQMVEGIIAKREAAAVQMAEYVGGGGGFISRPIEPGYFVGPQPTSRIRGKSPPA